MKNAHFFPVAGAMVLLISSCSVNKSVSVYLKADKNKIFQGDTVKVQWKVRNSRNVRMISMNGSQGGLAFKGDTFLIPHTDTTLTLTVFRKKDPRPIKRTRDVDVIRPEIIAFGAFRDRFSPGRVIVAWQTQGVSRVSIEGLKYDLPPSGTDTLLAGGVSSLTLLAKTPFTGLTSTCHIGDLTASYPYIKRDTAVFQLPGDHRIMFKISETDVSRYPAEVRLKVIVYDSLGNFITHLAPPYGDTVVMNKYFRKLIEKSDSIIREYRFEVREVHESPEVFDVSLVLDYSGSMNHHIGLLEESAKAFIRAKHPDDRISIVKYDHRLVDFCRLDRDETRILSGGDFRGMNSLGGSTALYASVDKGLRTFENGPNRKLLMLFTDGFENSSLMHLGSYAVNVNQVIRAVKARRSGMMIIGFGFVNIPLLLELALYTNGTFYYVSNPADIYQAFSEIRHNQRTYYEIIIHPISYEGEHLVQLTYFDNRRINTTQRPFYTGDDPDLTGFEIDTSAYWYSRDLFDNKYRVTVPPQALVNFDYDQDSIAPQYTTYLAKIVQYVRTTPKAILKVYGHTDTRGEQEYNLSLSERRALAVRNYLVSQGIAVNRIELFGLGESKPMWPDDKEEWAAKENRRVEIVIWEKVK